MPGREEILKLVPHQGSMCLWDEVVDCSAQDITLRAFNHRDVLHPLRCDNQLRAIHLCEYGAQAMAVHGGLLAREGATPRAGFLVALRGVQIQRVRIDDLPGELHGLAELLMQSDTSQQYAFRIECDGMLLAEGRAAVMLGAAQPAP